MSQKFCDTWGRAENKGKIYRKTYVRNKFVLQFLFRKKLSRAQFKKFMLNHDSMKKETPDFVFAFKAIFARSLLNFAFFRTSLPHRFCGNMWQGMKLLTTKPANTAGKR